MAFAFERKLNLLIGFPSTGTWTSGFGMSLVNLMGHLMATPVPGFRDQRIKPMQVKGSILSRSRAKLVQEAMADNCSHILFIDTDQTFPRHTAHVLLQHGKEVVGCNIATKQTPSQPTARRKSASPGGEVVYTDPDSPLLERVWRLGTGIMLVDMRVFRKTGARVFGIEWIEELQDYQGEDWAMCQAFEDAGFEIWVDHRLSDQVGHVGDFEYTHSWIGEKQMVEVGEDGERKLAGEV